MEKIKFVQIGCGKMSVYTMRNAIENGYEITDTVINCIKISAEYSKDKEDAERVSTANAEDTEEAEQAIDGRKRGRRGI